MAALLLGLVWLVGTTWLAQSGPVTTKELIETVFGDLFAVVTVPIALFRWRMVLEYDELILVFIRVRRLKLREIVAAKNVVKEGLVFVCRDGSEHSFAGVGNSRWGHRRKKPTRADLAARAVLCAAATARGEAPPVDYRLPRLSGRGLKRALIERGIIAVVIGLILGN